MTKRNPLVCGFQLAELCELWLRGFVYEHAGRLERESERVAFMKKQHCTGYGGGACQVVGILLLVKVVLGLSFFHVKLSQAERANHTKHRHLVQGHGLTSALMNIPL